MQTSESRPARRFAYVRNLTAFSFVTLFIGILIAFIILCYQYADAYVHHPRSTARYSPPDVGVSDYENINFATEDGLRLDGWFIAPSRQDGASFIFLHGHGGNRADLLGESAQFLEQGYGALYFDFRAHGTSQGDAITMGVNEVLDVKAAFAFMLQQDTVNPDRIALYGQSMGAATAIRAAALIPEVRVVISDSAYTSMYDAFADGVTRKVGIPPLFFPNIFIFFASQLSDTDFYDAAPIEAIPKLTQPIFLMHGTNDTQVSFHHAERLYAAANEPKELYLVDGAEHTMAYETDPETYREKLYPFLERYFVND